MKKDNSRLLWRAVVASIGMGGAFQNAGQGEGFFNNDVLCLRSVKRGRCYGHAQVFSDCFSFLEN